MTSAGQLPRAAQMTRGGRIGKSEWMPRLSRLVRVRFKVRAGISAKVIVTAALSQSSSCEVFMRAYLGNIVPLPGRGLPTT